MVPKIEMTEQEAKERRQMLPEDPEQLIKIICAENNNNGNEVSNDLIFNWKLACQLVSSLI